MEKGGNIIVVKIYCILAFLYKFVAPFVVPFLIIKKSPPLWATTPDDMKIPQGLYEPTVKKIYDRFGWFVSAWYWLGFRNAGHGIVFKKFAIGSETKREIVVSKGWIFEYYLKPYHDYENHFSGKYYLAPRMRLK